MLLDILPIVATIVVLQDMAVVAAVAVAVRQRPWRGSYDYLATWPRSGHC